MLYQQIVMFSVISSAFREPAVYPSYQVNIDWKIYSGESIKKYALRIRRQSLLDSYSGGVGLYSWVKSHKGSLIA